MARAIWTGLVQFVLISFPVKLYKATDDKGVSFKTFHNVCGNNIKQKKWCDTCGREVLPNELEKGFEVAKGQYVMFTEEEVEANLPESSKIIKIEKAVPADEIPLITYEGNYFLVPDKGGDHVYNLLFNALSLRPKVLIGKVVQRNKEHLVAIRPYSGGLLLSMLHFAGEVRDINDVVILKDKQVDKKELDLAVSLLDYLTGSFRDIDQKDLFRESIEKIAEMKSKGQVITIEAKKPTITTGSLVEALQKSIDMSKAGVATILGAKAEEKVPEIPEIKVGAASEIKVAPSTHEVSEVVPEIKVTEFPIKKEMEKAYGVTEEEIDKIILEQTIQETEDRINTLKELTKYKSFEEYVKDHKNELEGIEVSPDFKSFIIADDIYPRINLPILKKLGIVADHFGILIYMKSKKQIPKIRKGTLVT